jgi:signal transduction histidine kinase/GAF domain-containing protein
MHGYEDAIRISREHGYLQDEALAYELAAAFYSSRGFATTAEAYLRNARHRYEQWGALGKVKHLEARHPQLRSPRAALGSPTATMRTAGAELDAEIVARASQTLSSEIVLPKLIEKLMSLALEHAGAERGLLILLQGEPYIEAEATTRHGGVDVTVARVRLASGDFPSSMIQYVLRTSERIVCDDAAAESANVDDEYVRRRGSKSILCLPILKQTKVVGALYLENELTSHAFTSQRVAVLEMLASQAAISIENARLYSDLQLNEVYLKEAQRLSSTGSFYWRVASNEVQFSEQTYRHNEFDPGLPVTLDMIMERFHPDDVHLGLSVIDQARKAGADIDYEYRLRMPDGRVKYMHLVAPARREPNGELAYVGAIQDVTQARLAEQALAKARSELAHVSRVSSLGELTASIAHELNQPLTGIITNAGTCLRYLAANPPNLGEARDTLRQLTRDGQRAAQVIKRLRDLFSKRDTTTEPVDLNDIAREIIALSRNELQGGRIVLRSELDPDLPRVLGDRVQLQQVILNLLLNAAEAMGDVHDRAREILIRTRRESGGSVRFDLQDAGVGIPPENLEKLFEAFYTTKRRGMGMGLSVSRSIIENHHGRIWATPNNGPGATFSFSIPIVDEASVDG